MLLKRSLPFTVTTRKYNYMSAAQELAKKVRIHTLKWPIAVADHTLVPH